MFLKHGAGWASLIVTILVLYFKNKKTLDLFMVTRTMDRYKAQYDESLLATVKKEVEEDGDIPTAELYETHVGDGFKMGDKATCTLHHPKTEFLKRKYEEYEQEFFNRT